MLFIAKIIDILFYPMLGVSIIVNLSDVVFITTLFALLIIIGSWKIVSMKLRPDKSNYMSFPSGHSACAWFIAFTLFNANIYSAIWASLVSWSRVMLRRHHIEDVLVGLLLGAIFSMIVFYEKLKHSHGNFTFENQDVLLNHQPAERETQGYQLST